MLISTASFAAVVVLGVGIAVWWSNPVRPVNRAILGCSLVIASWLGCLHFASHVYGRLHPAPAGIVWLRMACVFGALLPMSLWITKEAIAFGTWTGRPAARIYLGLWLLYSFGVAVLCSSSYFIPYHATPNGNSHGAGYYWYIALVFVAHAIVLYRTFRDLQVVQGAARLELQVWLAGSCGTTMAILVTMTLNAFVPNPIYIRLQPLFVLGFYGGAIYAITSYRIFDARQILRLLLSRIGLGGSATLFGYLIFIYGRIFFSDAVAFIAAGVSMVSGTLLLRSYLDRRFEFYPQALEARRAAFEIASREVRIERLEARFSEILQGWGQAETALLLSGNGPVLAGRGIVLPTASDVFLTLRDLGWVTPERLNRERDMPGRRSLARFLADQRLGVLVVVESPGLNVVVGVGTPIGRRPFTFPQVNQLTELASIFSGPLERAMLANKMQHADQLATVGMLGASLAHEIRNPLVSLKAFVQLLPTRYHESAFRDKFFHLMTDEVKRIDRLTEQLLDLASPHVYSLQPIELNVIVRAGLELIFPRATESAVAVYTELDASPDRAYSDPAAVKQVLLNLCLNAIQVLEGTPDRWVRVKTVNGPGVLELTVSDSGPGIAPEIRERLFQPFQSTKSSGFGLGLAICRDILSGLDASIVVAPAIAGQGASFRVTFPCRP